MTSKTIVGGRSPRDVRRKRMAPGGRGPEAAGVPGTGLTGSLLGWSTLQLRPIHFTSIRLLNEIRDSTLCERFGGEAVS